MTETNGTPEKAAEEVANVAEESTEIPSENGSNELHKKIIRQIEYYFGDYNLGRDKFLRETTESSEGGWIPLETMIKFKRLQMLTTDFKVIVDSLKKSDSGLMEINEDETKIRRSKEKPLPAYDDARKENVDSRSAYVKGFPAEMKIDELLTYFKDNGNPEHVQMRYRNVVNKKEKSSVFKGSVFIVFSTNDELDEFLKKEDMKYNDTDLICESKKSYYARKTAQRAEFKEKKKTNKLEKQKEKEEEVVEKAFEYEKGCVLQLSNLSKELKREEIKEVFDKIVSVAYVGYNIGDEEAMIRFREPKAQEAIDKVKESNDGKIIIKDAEITAKVIEGEEEEKYYKEFSNQIAGRHKRDKFGRRGGRGGRFGRGFGGGRGGRGKHNGRGFKNRRDNSNAEDEPAKKKAKDE